VTGALDFMVRPVAARLGADDVIANVLGEAAGPGGGPAVFTGELVGPAVADGEKRVRVLAWCRERGVDPAACHAFGDSFGDLAMLESVGVPHAVTPDRRLRAIAEERGWAVLPWRG